MVQFLGNLGYAFAEATGVPEVNEEDETVEVTFFIEPGNRTYVNRINFTGNLSTADDVLRREMRQLESAPASSIQIEQSKVRLRDSDTSRQWKWKPRKSPVRKIRLMSITTWLSKISVRSVFRLVPVAAVISSSVRICRRKIFWEPVEQWVWRQPEPIPEWLELSVCRSVFYARWGVKGL